MQSILCASSQHGLHWTLSAPKTKVGSVSTNPAKPWRGCRGRTLETPSSCISAISCKQHLVLAAQVGADSLPCHSPILICAIFSVRGLTQQNQLTSQTNFWKHWLTYPQDTQDQNKLLASKKIHVTKAYSLDVYLLLHGFLCASKNMHFFFLRVIFLARINSKQHYKYRNASSFDHRLYFIAVYSTCTFIYSTSTSLFLQPFLPEH